MAEKQQLLTNLYRETIEQIIHTPENWMHFLEAACKNYKLRFDEQVLVYAQKPTAEAVLSLRKWNWLFARRVHRGAKGIAVFQGVYRGKKYIQYYFDFADTYETNRSAPVPIWHMKPEHTSVVDEALSQIYAHSPEGTPLTDRIQEMITCIAEDFCMKNASDILTSIQDSELATFDDEAFSTVYKGLATDSAVYMVLSRLGLEIPQHIKDTWTNLRYCTTAVSVQALGQMANDIAKIPLFQIARVV